jgi:uncharacterized protein YjbI with pentapeptide repeats
LVRLQADLHGVTKHGYNPFDKRGDMKPSWKKYLFYASLIIVGGGLILVLVETARAKNTGFETKTLWDWMELLIIPMVLAVGAFYLNRSERAVERQIAENRTKEDRQLAEIRIKEDRLLAEDRAKLEREIATDRQQEAALQAYLDRMADLLLNEKLRTTENEEIRDVARIRTLTALRGLDATRKGLVLRFLNEAELVSKGNPIVSLKGADLRGAHLNGANLSGADLSHANLYSANLFDADLSGTDLNNAIFNDAVLFNTNLNGANLNGTYLHEADLKSSNMSAANLSGAYLNGADLRHSSFSGTRLTGSDLRGSNLSGVDLSHAILKDADLSGADLSDSKVTDEQLATVKSLNGATLPDGTVHKQP